MPASVLAALTLLLQAAAEKPDEGVPAVRGALTPVYELDAVFESTETAELKAKLEAYTGELTVTQAALNGQPVRKGDPILAVDRGPFERALAQAEVDLRSARASNEKAKADAATGARSDAAALAFAEQSARDAEAGLKVFDDVDGRQMLETADLMVKFVEDALADQKEELDQLLKMYKSEELTTATSEIVVRRSRRNVQRLETSSRHVKEDAETIKTLRFPQARRAFVTAVENARISLESLRAQQAQSVVLREAELFKSTAALADAAERAAKLKRDAEVFPWRAPFDGRVFFGQMVNGAWQTGDQVAPMLHPGERLNPGQVLMTVCGPRTWARAGLPETDYFDVEEGLPAVVTPTSTPSLKSEGTVRSRGVVLAARGGAPGFELRIELKEPPATLFPGMKGKASVKGRELRDVILVPAAAVQVQGEKATVTVSKDGASTPRTVTTGPGDGTLRHIRSGLEAGEKVVVPK